jgi:hypothetical protein
MKERLNLMDEVEREAWRRQQSKDPKKESVCAKCGEELNPLALNSTYRSGFYIAWLKLAILMILATPLCFHFNYQETSN